MKLKLPSTFGSLGSLSLMILAAALPITAIAQDVIEKQPNGNINWSTGIVQVSGTAVIPEKLKNNKLAIKALSQKAKLDAYRNLAEMLAGVRVTSDTTVKQMMLESDNIRVQVDALIRGAKMLSSQNSDDDVTVTLEFDSTKGFVKSILPQEIVQVVLLQRKQSLQQSITQLFSQLFNYNLLSHSLFNQAYAATAPAPEITNAEQLEFAVATHQWLQQHNSTLAEQFNQTIVAYKNNASYTGLLVDARDVREFEMAVLPRIRNEQGRIIFPSENSSYDSLINRRPVSYDLDLKEATTNKRIALSPFTVKALATYKQQKSDLVISNVHADLIEKNAAIVGNINQAAVMIVVSDN